MLADREFLWHFSAACMVSLLPAFRFFRPDWPRILLALGLLSLVVVAGVLKPWPLALIVDCGLGQRPWPAGLERWLGTDTRGRITVLCGLLVALHLAHASLQAALNQVLIYTGLRGLARVRRAVFDWLLGISIKQLQSRPSGDIIYRATWDTYSFQTLFQQGLFMTLSALASVLLMVGVMWQLNLRLTMAALAVVPILLCLMQAFGRRMSTLAATAQSAESRLASLVQQGLVMLPLIQSHTAEPRMAAEFDEATGAAVTARQHQHRTEVWYLGLIAGLFALATGVLVWLGAGEVQAGRLTIGALWVFLAYLTQLYEPLSQLGHLGGTMSQARAGVGRVLELLAETETETGTRILTPTEALGDLEFRDVTFGYQADRPVLRGVSLRIPAGAIVALVGPSGAGKSTLLQLLSRFLDPDSGSVTLGGTDLRKFTRRSLRDQVAWVLQEPLLLPASIAENIAFGEPGATRVEIEAAARAAHAHGFVQQQPRGYDSRVGDGAVRLSVGEKQRLNLARAFLKDAPILLLDEPTSALDGASEKSVLDALHTSRRGRTTLMVAHRLETICEFDLVVVLAEGRVVEFGSPSDLRRAGGYLSQLREYSGNSAD